MNCQCWHSVISLLVWGIVGCRIYSHENWMGGQLDWLAVTPNCQGRKASLNATVMSQASHTPQPPGLSFRVFHFTDIHWTLTMHQGFIYEEFLSLPRPTFFLTPGASDKESICQCRRLKRHGFSLWVGKTPRRRKWWTTPVFLPGESHGQRNLVGYRPQGRKKSDTTECLSTCFAHNKALNIYQAKF